MTCNFSDLVNALKIKEIFLNSKSEVLRGIWMLKIHFIQQKSIVLDYLSFREFEGKLRSLKKNYDTWKDIVDNQNTAENKKFNTLNNSIKYLFNAFQI